MATVHNPAERLKVHHLQTAISSAAAEGNSRLIVELMRELARVTGSKLPDIYSRN